MTKILSILLSFAFFLLPIAEASQPSKGIVVTANKYASEAAAQIIKKGGTALDAAITAQLILTMTTPQSTGIGGGGFMLYWDNANSKLYAIDGREVAPLSANPDLFKDQKNVEQDSISKFSKKIEMIKKSRSSNDFLINCYFLNLLQDTSHAIRDSH